MAQLQNAMKLMNGLVQGGGTQTGRRDALPYGEGPEIAVDRT